MAIVSDKVDIIIMPVLDLTMNDAPSMQLCAPLVARQEASATGLARSTCSRIIWPW